MNYNYLIEDQLAIEQANTKTRLVITLVCVALLLLALS